MRLGELLLLPFIFADRFSEVLALVDSECSDLE